MANRFISFLIFPLKNKALLAQAISVAEASTLVVVLAPKAGPHFTFFIVLDEIEARMYSPPTFMKIRKKNYKREDKRLAEVILQNSKDRI